MILGPHKDHIYFHQYLFLFLPFFVLALDLLLNSTIHFNRLLWSSSASTIQALQVEILSPKDLIVSYCWNSYNYFFVLYSKSFCLSFSSNFLISSISFLISLVLIFLEKFLQLVLCLLYFPLILLKLLKIQLGLFLDLQLFFFIFRKLMDNM